MDEEPSDVEQIEITAALDRVEAESLRLEILRLARRSGVNVTDVAIRRVDPDRERL
jgi:hypothetical protein